MIVLKVIAAMLATLGLSVLFQTPKRQWIFCCLTGGFGFLISAVSLHFGLPTVLATVAATAALTILARLLATWREVPVSVFLLTGIFPLVPGVKIYLTASSAFLKDMSMFADMGMDALMQSGAIVMGILLASSIPQELYERLVKRHKVVVEAPAEALASEEDEVEPDA